MIACFDKVGIVFVHNYVKSQYNEKVPWITTTINIKGAFCVISKNRTLLNDKILAGTITQST